MAGVCELAGAICNTSKCREVCPPCKKPTALIEYLIKTYMNELDTVLDFCAGSFTTGIACINTKRHFIGIEIDKKYFAVGNKRIEEHLNNY